MAEKQNTSKISYSKKSDDDKYFLHKWVVKNIVAKKRKTDEM